MPAKLDQAARHKFDIELFFEDLYYVAKEIPGGASQANLMAAAHIIRSLCDERDISIVCLQPFMHYEGLKDRRKHAERVEEMQHWIEMAKVLQTHIIAIPSTFLSKEVVSDDINLIVQDLREVADIGASEGIRFAYESLAWGTYADTWEQSWRIVELVDRPNFGICLDTFNIAAKVYADPSSPNRRTHNSDTDMAASLQRMVATLDPRKIVFVQVVDAEYLTEPLVAGHAYFKADQPARMSWSRNCRLFYGEHERGAYLPIHAILRAILVDLEFEGWVSAEVFNKSLADVSPTVPEEHANRAAVAWEKIVADLDLANQPEQRALSTRNVAALRAQL
jgi:4-hydroxyphenylpyruvate dioxygenase